MFAYINNCVYSRLDKYECECVHSRQCSCIAHVYTLVCNHKCCLSVLLLTQRSTRKHERSHAHVRAVNSAILISRGACDNRITVNTALLKTHAHTHARTPAQTPEAGTHTRACVYVCIFLIGHAPSRRKRSCSCPLQSVYAHACAKRVLHR